MDQPRLFISIAAYRDPECQWTIKDLFERARYPDRIFIGLCWQFIEEEDAHCFEVVTRPEQCRSIKIDARESKGVCWARHQIHALWQGEEYTLQIDSHMRFVPDWDEKLFAILALCPSPKAVLSSLMPRYWPPHNLGPSNIRTMRPHYFDDEGLLLLLAPVTPVEEAPGVPQPNPFVAAGYLFGPAEIISEVPYDPHIYFMGEGITLAARLWTKGWDIYTPNQVIMYHRSERIGRRLHWQDHPDEASRQRRMTGKRVRHFFGIEPSDDPEAIREIAQYSLGTIRSLDEYEAFSGVDFRRRLVYGKTNDEIALDDPVYRRLNNLQIFRRLWASTAGKKLESRSGPDATLDATRSIREALPVLFQSLGIRSLADAGCGDGNWMSKIAGSLTHYWGGDIFERIVDHARKRFDDRCDHSFATVDITIDTLPLADAILCRDVLNYLPAERAVLALKLFKGSGARYLIATTDNGSENATAPTGSWRATCLTAAPFNLPPPLKVIEDGAKDLGIWEMEKLVF